MPASIIVVGKNCRRHAFARHLDTTGALAKRPGNFCNASISRRDKYAGWLMPVPCDVRNRGNQKNDK